MIHFLEITYESFSRAESSGITYRDFWMAVPYKKLTRKRNRIFLFCWHTQLALKIYWTILHNNKRLVISTVSVHCSTHCIYHISDISRSLFLFITSAKRNADIRQTLLLRSLAKRKEAGHSAWMLLNLTVPWFRRDTVTCWMLAWLNHRGGTEQCGRRKQCSLSKQQALFHLIWKAPSLLYLFPLCLTNTAKSSHSCFLSWEDGNQTAERHGIRGG